MACQTYNIFIVVNHINCWLLVQKMTDEVVQPMVAVSKVGMYFELEEKAYEMYNTYASKIGFSVRKSYTKR
jgi:hypothetical protein